MQATPTQQPRHRLPGEALSALRRVEAFAIQVLGDLRKAGAGSAQAINAGYKGGGIGELVITRHWTTYAMRAGHAPSPRDRHIDLFTVLVHINGDTLHQHTHDLLAVLRRRVRGVPQGWDVVRQAQDCLPLTGRQLRGTLASEARILLLQVLLVTERLFPAPLQLTGDEAVFGLDGFVSLQRHLHLTG